MNDHGQLPPPTWIFSIDPLGPDTYALRRGGEVSLVNTTTLKKFLRQQQLGVFHDMGGDDVAGA